MPNGITYKGLKSYLSEGPNSTPYNKFLKAYDSYIGEAYKNARQWRLVSACLGVGLLLAVGASAYLAIQPRNIPYVIDIAAWGEVKNVGEVGRTAASEAVTDVVRKYHLQRFVRLSRGYSTDDEVVQASVDEAYQLVTPAAADLLTTMYREEKTWETRESNRRDVVFDSVLRMPATQNGWQVDWKETTRDKSGGIISEKRYRGLFTLIEGTIEMRLDSKNPLGLYIKEFSITALNN